MTFMHASLLLFLLVLSFSLPLNVKSKRLCEESGYACSQGHVKPWMGDMAIRGKLREGLTARSFNREVILLHGSADYALPLLQTWNSIDREGFAHTLSLMPDRASCEMVAAFEPRMGCVWSSDLVEIPEIDGAKPSNVWLIQHFRHRLAARSIRLGYSVLSLDADVILFRDPYLFLKSSPFNQYQLITQVEAGNINVGIMYANGAARGGPVAWLWAEIAYRQLRWADALSVKPNSSSREDNVSFHCVTWEQTQAGDALLSAASGRPLFMLTLLPCASEVFKRAHEATWYPKHEAYLKLHLNKSVVVGGEKFKVPELWRMGYLMTEESIGESIFVAKIPNARGSWPEEFGGRIFPVEIGPLSSAFINQLKQDGIIDGGSGGDASSSIWPDPDEAESIISEKVLMSPPWLFGPWKDNGNSGCWEISRRAGNSNSNADTTTSDGGDLSLGLTPLPNLNQVIGHIHVVNCGTDGFVKRYFSLFYGAWSMDLAVKWHQHQFHQHPDLQQLYLGSPAVYEGRDGTNPRVRMKGFSSAFRQSSTPYGFGRGLAVHRRSPLRPLLTLSPLFDWSLVKSVRDFRILLRGMLKVALATGRAIGWPAVPCSMNGDPKRATSWPLIDTNGLPLHPKHSCGLGFKPRSDFAVRRDPVTNETLCEWSELISHGCLNWHQGSAGTPPWGILPLELPYYLFDLSNLNVDKKDGNSHAGGGSLSLREVVLGLRREGTETVASDPSFAQDQTQDETQDRILAQDHYLGLTVAVLRTSTQGYSSSHDDSKGSSSYGRHVAIIDLSEAPLFNHTLSHIGASALIPRVNATMLRAKLNSSYGHHGDEAVRGALTLHWHMVAVVGSGSRTMTTSTISPGPDILLIEAPLDAWIEEDSPEAAWLRPQLDITQLMGSNCAAVRDKVNCLN